MAAVKQQIYCTFPKDQIGQPVLYSLGQMFKVIPNVRGASINDDIGLVYLELEGEDDEVKKAIDFLRQQKVSCELLPEDARPPSL